MPDSGGGGGVSRDESEFDWLVVEGARREKRKEGWGSDRTYECMNKLLTRI